MTPQRAIITGAAGLVGSHIAAQLLQSTGAQWDVHCVVRNEKSKQRLADFLGSNLVTIHIADLEDFEQVKTIVMTVDADVVFNAAAKVSIGDNSDNNIVSTNVDITHFIVKSMLAHGRGALVHISSVAAIGHRNVPQKMDESCQVDSLDTMSMYGKSKLLSENEVWRAIKMGLNAVIVNPSVILGVLNTRNGGIEQVLKLVSGKMPFYTKAVMGFVDVRDVAIAAELLAQQPSSWGQRYCLNGYNVSYKELIEKFSGRKPRFCVPKWGLRVGIWLLKLAYPKSMVKPDMVSFLTSQSMYDGGKIVTMLGAEKFQYTSFENCVEYIKGQLR